MKSLREQLIEKIQETPDYLLPEFLDFLLFINYKATHQCQDSDNPYPLRGLPIEYFEPTEPVAIHDWDSLL